MAEALDAARLDELQELAVMQFIRIWIIHLRSIRIRTSMSRWHSTPAT
jgi:hypothetical protein